MKPLVVGVTGASGVLYAKRLVEVLVEAGRPVEVVISEPARLVIHEELGIRPRSFTAPEDLAGLFGSASPDWVRVYSPRDFTAPIASGSYPVAGMIVIPCSMGTLGAIASGISQNLIHRAADCMLKENRPLVLVPRETPLSAIHLENMLKLARLGARIVPAMPGFYAGTRSLQEIVDFVVGKVLDQIGIEHVLYPRWTGSLNSAGALEQRP